MAMGGRGQREATSAISACRPFSNSTGSLRGTRGPTRDLGWLSSHQEARRIKELLSRATYVVWSYNTPIGFVSEDEDGERTAYYIDESHSPTTSHHQTLVRVGMGDFETIGEGPGSRSTGRSHEPAETRYTPFRVEHASVTSLEQLLDPRYSDPDWVPGRDIEADYAAERRDAARVEREQAQKGFRL